MSENKLNNAQKEAVEYVAGPLLIVAGAGTGKTTVITRKIAYLLEKELAKPEEILALTFTDKSANEMVERVDKMVEMGYVDLQISTFHSFCQRLLERFALDIGLPNQFKLFTATDAWLLVRQNLDKFDLDYYRPLGNPTRHIHELLKHFSKCKDELISPADYLKYAEEVKLGKDDTNREEKSRLTEIASAYHTYNQLLLDNNALDFGDLIYYTNQLLTKRPNILKGLQERYKFILVDEFQDVNWAQYNLVRLITTAKSQLTAVGDDDQSIYAFRGASVSNILRFKDDFPEAKEIVLTENYRSDQKILDAAYKLIKNNDPDRLEVKLGIDKRLVSCHSERSEESLSKTKKTEILRRVAPQDDNCVVHSHEKTLDDEVKFVVEEIKKIKSADKEAVWDDFAILARANSHAEPFLNALEKQGVPYEFLASSGLFRQSVILDCLNFFKATDNYHESTAIYRLLLLPFLKFPEQDLQKLTHFAKKKAVSLHEALKRDGEIRFSAEAVKARDLIFKVIEAGRQNARVEKPTIILYEFLFASGYLAYLTKGENAGNREVIRRIYHLQQFFDYLKSYEDAIPGASVAGFMEYYQNISEGGEEGKMQQPSDTPDSVNILTVHGAKGLEFRYVFMVNLVEDRFPSRRRGEPIEIPLELIKEQLPEGDSHIEEERRLFYVGVTRAKDRLYLLSASDYGGQRNKKASRFLEELGFVTQRTATPPNLPLERGGGQPFPLSKGEYKGVCRPEEEKAKFVFELPEKFSFSQIKSYRTCPYQYKLANVLKVPTKGSGVFSFGQSMHATLQKFYGRVQELNQVEQGSLFGTVQKAAIQKGEIKVPELDELLKIYEVCWIPDWYKDKKQREGYFKKGQEILRAFYKSHTGKWTVPVALESYFKIRIGKYILSGRIDRVDQLPDGKLEIIDYKTGRAKEKVTGEDKDQLLIYQIALLQLPEYKNIGEPGQLTYYYLNDDVKISFLGEDKELAKVEEEIVEILDKIHSLDFIATPGSFACDHCDFRDICEFRV
ncbi:MAG: ATP-dependent DNA helicase [Patescibacteria group bacterium]